MDDLPPENASKFLRIFSFLSLFLILFIQLILYVTPYRDQVVVPTPIWYGVGIFLFLLVFFPLRRSKFINRLISIIPFSGSGLLIFFSVGFSLLVMVGAVYFDRFFRSVYLPITTLWLLSAFFFVSAFFPYQLSWSGLLNFFNKHRREIIGISLITLLALILRLYKLGDIPFVINGDEGWIGMAAQGSDSGPLANPFALWENFGALYLHSIRICIRLLGNTSFALRLLPALGGILAVPAVYLLARQIAGSRVALISAFLLATSHTHLNFSRTVAVGYIQGTWLVPLELFFLLRGLTNRNSWYAALGGVLLAIHYSIYLSSQIITGLIVVFLVILFIFYRAWFKTVARQVLVFWAGFLTVFLPELIYILRNPDSFLNRFNLEGSFQTGWVEQTAAATGKSVVQVLIERVIHAFLTLIYYPALDFYGTQSPIFTFLTAALFIIGLGFVLYGTRKREYLLLNGYFWAITCSVGIFAIPPSADSYRMLAVLPAAVILAAVGLVQLIKIMESPTEKPRLQNAVVVGLLLISIFGSNFKTYFLDFANSCKYGGDTQTRFSTHFGYFLGALNRDATVYLLSNEVIFYGQNLTVDFLSDRIKVENVNDPIETLSPVSGSVIIAIPARKDELLTWARAYPEGEIMRRYDCRNEILTAFIVP